MASERFEMRIDRDLLERLDNWRKSEDNAPSRAEAVRQLLESGLTQENKGRVPNLSDGEKLIVVMLGDLIKKLSIETDTNVDLIQKIIFGGHYWALGWELPGIFHDHVDKQSQVRFVVDILDMWMFLEEAFEALDNSHKEQLAKEIDPLGKHVHFPGFDGNNEVEYLGIARFLIEELKRFSRFRDNHRDLNSHHPMLETYDKMFRMFEPIRKTLIGRRMNVAELAIVLNARRIAGV